ncbi:MAG: [FeFe] hydrogenase H-cluster radical SAM maturase HydG, partial [Bacteroidetes bacterium]|nr:[FeFe] hydrogenase H-cluster radical SAM maturase HydG [Bacteroidota bacterium]
KYLVSDNDFEKLVAILRLAVPYTGMILTARENEAVRDKVIEYGCSQIDAGTNIEINGYIADGEKQDYNKEQFSINDQRSLSNMIKELISKGYVPSFCTACYRAGRTGEHFMEYSVPGFIHNFCTPNSLLTLAEYLEDYADDETKTKGYLMIESSLAELKKMKKDTHDIYKKLQSIKNGERDLFY